MAEEILLSSGNVRTLIKTLSLLKNSYSFINFVLVISDNICTLQLVAGLFCVQVDLLLCFPKLLSESKEKFSSYCGLKVPLTLETRARKIFGVSITTWNDLFSVVKITSALPWFTCPLFPCFSLCI